MLDRRRLIAGAATAGAGCLLERGLGRAQGPVNASAQPGSVAGDDALKAHAEARGLRTGTAVNVGLLQRDPEYRRVLAEQYDIVVAENAMKWGALRPAPQRYRFDEADALVAFAEQHGMAVRGHNLCWHEALPAWFAATVTKENAAATLTEHIRTVAGRYKGRIRAWDVVNEAVLPGDGRPDGLRDSPWLRLLGPEYLALAFRTAREADPHALLTYNDYDIEYDHAHDAAKRAAVLQLLKRLKAEGVPLDAVGVQSHLTAGSPNPLGPGILAFVAEARQMGLKVFITELDVNDDSVAADDPAVRDQAVAKVYGEYVTAMLAEAAVVDVLTWGVSDKNSWLNTSKTHEQKHPGREERALPFDAEYQPKPAYFALRGALDSRKSYALPAS